MKNGKIKIHVTGFTSTVELPAMLYEASIKALEYAIKHRFSRDIDTVYSAKETLALFKEAIKDL